MSLRASCIEFISDTWNLGSITESERLKESENHTWRLQTATKQWILRITPSSHRRRPAIESEIAFNLVMSKSLHTTTPQPSRSGEFVVDLQPYDNDPREWVGVLYEFVPGESYGFKSLTDPSVIEEWGRVMGKMHKIASGYGFTSTAELDPTWQTVLRDIPRWDQTHSGALSLERIAKIAEDSEIARRVHEHWVDVLARLDNLVPKTAQTWGVVHGDLNLSNFSVEWNEDKSPRLWIFDFDQSHVTWFAADVVQPFFFSRYLEKHGWGGAPMEGFDRHTFESAFLKGYRSEYAIDDSWLDVFVEYRVLYNTSVSLDIINKQKSNPHFEEAIMTWVNKIVAHYDSSYPKKE